ncbi:MAG TPA: oxygen-independent coproporphyrinogen III oxidase-like protein [Gammaproteobacteria bacterium]|nr:oxygen-independent coproporphyrinogen III oxidase-like protein [Gammaproteobacteria bacterium]
MNDLHCVGPRLAAPPPLALYVHVPWCARKCPYCDFNSHEVAAPLPEADYVAALVRDLEQDLPAVWGRPVGSIFVGGGTPSLLSPEAVETLLSALRARLPLIPDAEITLEANPGTVDRARLAAFRAAGVNRISLGVQSFDDRALKALGRIHDGAEAHAAVAAVQEAGFSTWNLDLMFGLPGQDRAGALADLDTALALEPPHLSHYQLTLEPNTLFHHKPPPLPGEDEIWAMQEACGERLAAAGFAHYEVSAHARPGHRCRHNLNYWRFGDYLGIGAGAHAKISDAASGTVTRCWKVRHPRAYLKHAGTPAGVAGRRVLNTQDLVLEFMMNALRLAEGVPRALFQARTGLSPAILAGPVAQAVQRGLLEDDPLVLRPTPMGRRFLDELLTLFMAEDAPRHLPLSPA